MLIHFSCRVNLVHGTTIQRKCVLFWKSSTVNLDRFPLLQQEGSSRLDSPPDPITVDVYVLICVPSCEPRFF